MLRHASALNIHALTSIVPNVVLNVTEPVKFLQEECIRMEDAQLIVGHISRTHLTQKPTANSQPTIKIHSFNSQSPIQLKLLIKLPILQ